MIYLYFLFNICSASEELEVVSKDAFPIHPNRSSYTFDWCDCSTGHLNVTVWPSGYKNKSVIVHIRDEAPVWVDWINPIEKIGWRCSGMVNDAHSVISPPKRWWSIQLSQQQKAFPCDKVSGRLHFVNWEQSNYTTAVVYSSGESNYFCIKIPVLLRTTNNTLLAFAEARRGSCSDFAATDLVVKSSIDDGLTWSPLRLIRTGIVPDTVIGNAAPVQIKTGRILLPHTRNNSDVWYTWSDDDGVTWATAVMIRNSTLPKWKWVGTGPPGSIQLQSGRILVPSYHSNFRDDLVNNIVHGHVYLSDDDGITWRLASASGFGEADKFSNECQAVQLKNGSVLINARSFSTLTQENRIQTLSDDGGETFGPTRYVPELPQPFDGCQGSTVRSENGTLFFTGPASNYLRDHLSLWQSDDEGSSWKKILLIDSGSSGYSSLQANRGGLDLLYEQSDKSQLTMVPDRFIYLRLG